MQESQFFLRFSRARCQERWHKINPDRCSLRYWGERVSKHLVTSSLGIFGKHSFVPHTGTGPEHFVYNRRISFLASVLLWAQALCFWVKFSFANDDRSLCLRLDIRQMTNCLQLYLSNLYLWARCCWAISNYELCLPVAVAPPNLGDNQLIGDTRDTSSLSGGDNIDLQLDKLWPRQTSIVEKSCIVKSKRKVLSSQKSITLWIHSILCNRVLLPRPCRQCTNILDKMHFYAINVRSFFSFLCRWQVNIGQFQGTFNTLGMTLAFATLAALT